MYILRSRLFINSVILLFLFLVSILVRLDNLKDPMGRHHEWLTGHVLSTVYNYETDGAIAHYCAPVWTFNTKADRCVVAPQPFKDKNNYAYYVSYPPMCFLLPHWVFMACGTHATVTGIRVINLVVHFFVAFFVYLICMKLFDRKMRDCIFLPAIIAFGLYVFAAGNLWFHGHVFFADMLVPLFIASFLYVLLHVLKNELSTTKACLLLFITCALGAYTEWQMLFVAFFVSVFLFFKGFRERRYFIYFFIVCLATILPLLIVYLQYQSIAGTSELAAFIIDKYKLRSGVASNISEAGLGMDNSFSFQRISEHYELNYATLLDYGWYALLLFPVLALINRMLNKGAITFIHFLTFAVIFASIFLHHYVFFNFTAVHDFSTLKISLLLSLFCGYVLGLVFVLFELEKKRRQRNWVIGFSLLAFGWFFHLSTQSYYKVNQRGTLDTRHMVIGEIIQRHIKQNEFAFCTLPISPEAQWYGKRNILTCINTSDAAATMRLTNCELNGQVIKLNDSGYEVFKINMKGDTIGYVKDEFVHLECIKAFKH